MSELSLGRETMSESAIDMLEEIDVGRGSVGAHGEQLAGVKNKGLPGKEHPDFGFVWCLRNRSLAQVSHFRLEVGWSRSINVLLFQR